MQSNRNSGADRAARRAKSMPQRHGLFASTTLIPTIAALASVAGRKGAASLLHSTALVPAAIALTAAGMLVMPDIALAQTSGGRGGNNLGLGGASSETGVGADGAGNANSGGGGGAGVIGGNGGNGGGEGGGSAGANGSSGVAVGSGGGGGAHGYFGATVLGTAAIGGNGGAGAASDAGASKGGGGGGAGGFGAVITGIGNLGTLNVNVSGGTGGNGGTGSFGGYGGSGGVGLALIGNAANLTVNRTVIGGNGGSGGAAVGGLGAAGVAGNGGVGLNVLGANSIVTIGSSATVTGGNSGPALNGAGQSNGGIGITGSNLTLIVAGFVSGGTGVFGRERAVSFTGGTNVLELQTGATFIGDVVANSAADTLRLGGATNWTFNASLIGSSSQFRNFGVFEKVGAGTTTLTGSTSAATPWAINGGALSISADGAQGASGPISFNGGTLVTTAGITSARNITLNAGGGTISPATATSLTLSGILSGSGSLTKGGAGTLALSGQNTIGSITVASGTLRLENNSAAGGSAGIIRTTGSVIDLAQGVNNTTPVELNSNATQFQVTTGTATQSGIISEIGGARPIEKIGAGSLILSGLNSYSGGTVISGGTLRIGADANLGAASGGITINNNANLTFTSALTTSRAITLSGTANIDSDSDVTLSGVIGGTGTLTKFLGGTLTLTNTNNYSGGTTVNGGTLQIGIGGTTGTLGSGTVTLNGTNLVFNRSDDITVANDVTSTGTVIKRGGGTVTLTGGKSYSNTTVEAGTLALRGTSVLSGGGLLQMLGGTLDMGVDGAISSATHNGGTLALGGKTLSVITGNYALQSGSITGGGVIAMLGNSKNFNIGSTTASIAADVTIRSVGINNAVFITSPDGNYTLASNLDGSSASGPGSMSVLINNLGFTTTLSGNNNYRLGTTVNSGTIAVGSDTALGTGTLFLNPNTALTSVGLRSIANPINLVAGSIAIRNTDTSNTFTLSGVISGTTGFTKTGAGTLILTGANTYQAGTTNTTFTTISEGMLQIGNGGTTGALGSGAVTNNAILAFNRSNDITVANEISGTGTLRKLGAGVMTLSSAITQGAVVVDAGTLALGAANTIGGITVSGGTLRLAATGAAGGATGLITTTGSVIDYANLVDNTTPILLNSNTTQLQVSNAGDQATQSGTISEIGGARPLEKIGAGTLVLSGLNTYSGGTTITAGTLFVGRDGALGAASGGLTIGNATLQLTDTATSTRAVNIADSATILTLPGSNWTFGGAVSGNGSLTKGGTGTLVLSGNNSYAATTINAGTLQIGADTITGTLGTSDVINNATLVFNRANDLTVASRITGTGSVIKRGGGTLILSGLNTYSGVTTISAGTIQLGAATGTPGTLGSGTVLIASGASLRFEGAGSKSVTGPISGAGSVIVGGTGSASLNSATGSYSGGTIVNSGTLVMAGATSAGTGVITMRGGTLRANSAFTLANELIIAAGADVRLQTNLASETLRLANVASSDETRGFNLLGTLRIAAASGGTVQFSAGSVTFANAARLIIESGTLLNTTTTTLPGILNMIDLTQIESAGTLNLGGITFGGTDGIKNLQGSGTLINDGRTTTIKGGSFSGNISGTQNITSTGTLTLSGASSFTGDATVSSGTLTVTNSQGLGTAAGRTTIADGATVALSSDLTLIGENFTISGSGVGGNGALRSLTGFTATTGTVTLAADARITSDSSGLNLGDVVGGGHTLSLGGFGLMAINGAISNLSELIKVGGQVTLFGTNSFTGRTTVNGGILDLIGGSSLSDTAQLTVNSGAFVRFSNSETIGSLTGSGSVQIATGSPASPSTTLTTGGDNTSTTYSGNLQGAGSLIKTGTGTFTLANTAINTGTTTISAGTLQIGNGGTAGALGTGAVFNNAALIINRSNDITVNNAISGIGTLTKLGAGVLTLGGTSSYSGGTTVSAGTLALNHATAGTIDAAGTGAINLGNGTTLQSNVGGNLTNGINIATGNSAAIGAAGGTTLALTGNSFVNSGGAGSTLTFGSSTLTGQVTLAFASGPTTNVAGAGAIAGGTVQVNSVLAGSLFGALQAGTTVGTGATSATLNLNGVNVGLFNLAGSASGFITNQGTQAATLSISSGTGSTYAGVLTNGTFALNLTKSQSGTLTLTGNNSYTGTTAINAGTLQIGDGGTSGTLGTGNVTNSGVLTFNRSNNLSVANAITGNGTLNKLGAGTLVLTGANAINGAITISAGTLQIGDGGTAGTLGTGVVTNNGTLALNLASAFTRSQAINGTGTLLKLGTGTSTLTGAITQGSATVQAGTLVLRGANTFTNGITVAGGTLSLEGDNAAGGATSIIRTTGSVINYSNGLFMTTPIELNSNTTQLQVLSGQAFQSGAISQTGGARPLEKIGDGALVLSAANSYTGLTTISGGTLRVGLANALTSSSGIHIAASGAVLDINGFNQSYGSLTGVAGSIVTNGAVASATLTLGAGDGSTTFGGRITNGTGALSLTKTGTGTLTLAVDNSYTGLTTVANGTLTIGTSLGLGTAFGPTVVQSGATLAINAPGSIRVDENITLSGTGVGGLGALRVTGGSIVLGGVIRLGADALMTADASTTLSLQTGSLEGLGRALTVGGDGSFSIQNTITGLSSFIKTGSGTTSLLGTLTAGQININQGVFRAQQATGFGGDPAVTVNGGATLQLVTSQQIGSLAGGGTVSFDPPVGTTPSPRLITGGANTSTEFSGTLGGAGRLFKTGTGTFTLTGDNSYTGTTTILGGTLQIGNGGTTGTLGTGAIANNAALLINLSSDLALTQAISGTGAFTKLGSGFATVSGNITQGSATVQAGTLALSGSNSFTTGITVAGGTLALRSANAAGGAAGIIRTTGSVIDYSDGLVMATPIQINSATTQFQVLTGAANQSGVISEAGGARPLEKIGAGTLTLSGVNSYSGGTVITAGRLNVASDANLGATAGGITIGSGILGTTATLSSARSVALTGVGGVDVADGTSLTLTGAVNGAGSLTKTGNGQLVLTANNTYAGTTTISGTGGLTVGAGGATGTLGAGNVTVNTGSVLAFDRSTFLTVANVISGAGSVSKQGSGILRLIGANTYSGGTTVSGGTLLLGSVDAGVINAAGTGNIQLLANTILRGDLTGTLNNSLTLNAANVTVAAVGGTTLRLASNQLFFDGAAGSSLNFGTSTLTGKIELAPLAVSLGAAVNPITIDSGEFRLANANAYTLLNGSTGVTLTNTTLGAEVAGTLTKPLTVAALGSTIEVAAASMTLQGGTTLTGSLTKAGAGELRLTGTGAGSGAVQVNAGTLAVQNGSALADATAVTVATGATLQLLSAETIGVLSGAGQVVLGANDLTLAQSTNSVFSGVISGSGGLTKSGSGSLSLRGANTFTGLTTALGNFGQIFVDTTGSLAGAVAVRNQGSFINSGTIGGLVTVDLGGNFRSTTTGTLARGLVNNGVSNVSGRVLGAVTNTGSLTVDAPQTLNVSGAFVQNGGIFILNGGSATIGSLAGIGTVSMIGAATLTTGGDNTNTTYSGRLTAGSGLTKVGAGGLTLSGSDNFFNGNIRLNGGTLQIDSARALGSGLLPVSVQTALGTNLVFAAPGTYSISHTISGAGVVSKISDGTLTLTGNNSYTGGTSILAGTLRIGSSPALGTGGVTMAGQSLLTTATGVSATVNGLTLDALANVNLSAASGQTLTLGGTLSTSTSGNSIQFGTASQTGTVAFGFTSVQPVAASTSVAINGGTLRLNALAEGFLLAAGGGLSIAAPGTLDLNGFAGGGVNLSGAGAVTNASATAVQFTASQTAASTFSGVIGGGTGAISLLKTGTGALTLTGANTYTGTTSITGGSLQIGDGGTTGSLGTGNVSIGNGAQLLLNRSDALSLANVFTGAGTVQKNLANTLTLTGSNTAADAFTGTFNVNGGTLLVNGTFGDVTNRAATVNIASGATLGGAGTIQGNVVVANGGILSPGNSAATQTITGNLVLNESSALNFELAQPSAVGGGTNDLITVGGNLVLDGTLNVTALSGFDAGYYRLFNYGGTLTNNQVTAGTLPLGFTSSIVTDIAGQVNILFNAGGQTVQYWDGADLTGATATVNGEGGAGSWSSTATNWTSPSGFAVNSAWAGQAGIFAGAAGGVVSVTGTQAFQELRFLTNGYTLNPIGSTDGLATTGGFSIINVDTGLSTRLNTPISGTAGLTKTGAGTLTLAGANSYSGSTTVTSGTLSLLSGGVIAGAVQNNATLTNTGTINGLLTNIGTLTSTGTLAGGLTNATGASANVAGNFGGSSITNTGTLTLTGLTGGIGAFSQNAGGTTNLGGQSVSFASLAGAGTIAQSGPGVLTIGSNNASTSFAGNFTGTLGSIVKTGTGTQTFTGSSSWAGLTTVDGGTLAIGSGGSLAGGVLNRATFSNAGTVSGSVINSGTLVSTGVIGGGLTNNAGAIANIAGQLNGAVNNTGTITLTGTITGMANVSIGTGGALNLAGFATSIGSLSGTGGIALGNAQLTTGASSGAQTFDGIISGTGGLVKINAASTLTLRGANTYTGLTTVSGGRLIVSATGRLAGAVQNDATLIVDAGAIAGLVTNAGSLVSTGALNGGLVNNAGVTASVRGTLNGSVTNAAALTLTGATTGNAAINQSTGATFNLADFSATIGSLAGTGAVQLGSGTLTLGSANTSTDFGGAISGSGALVKTGTATQTLSGANSFTGLTTVNQGTILVATTGALAGAVQNNATLTNAGTVSGLVTNAGALVSSGRLDGGLVNAAGATASLGNSVSGSISNSGAITLAAALTGSGAFTQDTGGTLTLAGFSATLGSLAGSGTVQLGAGALTVGGSNIATSFDGVITGTGSFTKTGTAALTLGGANAADSNFTGTVNINAGSLVLNGRLGDAVANSATLNIANGATLSGTGTFLGNVAMGTGGIFAPGNSPGTLAIGGNLLLDASSVLNFELAQAGVVGGGVNDLITVGGNLTLDGTLNVTSLTGFGAGIYRLFNYGGSLTDNGLALGTLPGGFTSSLVTGVAGQISVQFVLGVPTTLYWDGADATAASVATNGNGGAGTWNSATTNWTSAPGFNTNFAWGGQTGVFAGAAGGVVSIAGTQAFQQLRFETGGYTLAAAAGGGSLATTGGLSIIDVSAGLGATINAPIQGTAGLTKAGTGTLTLGGANSYTGLTSIAAGTLALSAGATIAGAVENTATFTSAGTVAGLVTNSGTLAATGTLGGGLTNNAGATAAIAGQLSGAVSNSGTITLTGATNGIGAVSQNTGATLNLAGFSTSIGSLAGSGSVQLGTATLTLGTNNANTSFAGVVSGSGGLTKTGSGTLTLSGANGYTGLTTAGAGSLTVAADGSLAGAVQNNATFTNAGSVAGLVTNAGTLASTGKLGGGLTNNTGATAAIAGQLSGPVSNSGTITLTGATIGIGAFSQNAGSTLNLAGFSTSVGSLAGSGSVQLGSGTLTLGSNNANTSFTGVVSGSGGLTKTGSGTLTLSGANSYTGLTTVGAGSFVVSAGGSLAGAVTNGAFLTNAGTVAGTVTNSASLLSTGTLGGGLVNNAGALASVSGVLNGAVTNAGTLNITGQTTGNAALSQVVGGSFNLLPLANASIGSLAGAGSVQLGTGTLTVGSNNASTSFAGVISGSGGLTKAGTGTLTLSGASSLTGLTTINQGALIVSATGSMSGAVQNNATFTNAGSVGGLVTNAGTLASTGTLGGGFTNNAGATAAIAGQLTGTVSNAGTITLTGATTGIGPVSQSAGATLNLAGFSTSIGSLAGTGAVQLGSGTLTVGSNNASTSFAGVISGSGGLTKSGTGTLTLSGANSLTGLTTINQGALIVSATGSMSGAVQNNATFTNAGSIAGLVTNAGALASTGTLGGGITNNAGATAAIAGQLSGAVSNAGTITLTGATTGIGAVSQNAGATLNLAGFSTSIGSLAGTGALRMGSGTLTLGSNNASTSFAGVISGSGGLTKTGSGSFILAGANDFTGTTTVNAGTLAIGTGGSLAGGVVNAATFSNAGSVAGAVSNAGTLVSTGTLAGALTNAAGGVAQLSGLLTNAVSNAGSITLTGTLGGITVLTQQTGGTLDLAGFSTSIGSLAGGGSVQLGSGVLTTGSDNGSTSFDGTISGAGGLTKTGSGSFALSGANSFAGLATVRQGVLSVRNATALGTAAGGTTVESGAALELQGGITVAGEALTLNGSGVGGAGALRSVADNNVWAGTVTLASDSLITADSGRLDLNLLTGSTQALTTGGAGLVGLANATTAGALTVTGGSTALFGSGDFAAGVNVNAGNLFLQGGSSINDAATVALGSGNLIVAASETIGSLVGTGGTVQIDAGQTLTMGGNNGSTDFAGVIFSTGNLAKQGSGTFTVTGLLSHSGTTSITGGTLAAGAANIWSGNGLVTIGAGGTLSLGGFEQSIAAISLAGGTLANGSLTGSISSAGGTIRDVTGTANALQAIVGTTTLTGSGSFAQGVTLAGGDVVLQGAGASIADAALVTVNGGTLFANVSETIGALAGSGGRVQIAADQTLTTGGSNASTAYAGVLAGSGALIKTGSGTFTLSGANTLTGTTSVSSGVLALTSGGSLAGAVQNNAGFSNAGTVAGLVTNTGTLISTGVLNGGLANSGSAGLSGQLNGAVTNSGLVQLQGALTGIIGFNQVANATFDLAGFNTSIGSLSGAGSVLLGSGTLTLGGSNAATSFGGMIGGTGGLIKTGTSSFTLTSGQAYTGLTTVNAGLLSLTASAGLSGSVLNNAGFASSGLILGSLTNNGAATLAGQINGAVANSGSIAASGQLIVLGRLTQNAGGSLNLAGFNASLGSLAGVGPIQLGSGTLVVRSDNSTSLFSGVISGSGGLQKLGTGTFTLTGINSYTGLTVVNAGTLVIGEGASVGGTTGSIAATVDAPAPVIASLAAVANPAPSPIVAEQASMPAAVVSLAAATAPTGTATSVTASIGTRADMLADNGWIAGGRTPASLTSSTQRLPIAGGVSSGPEQVELFADPVAGAVSADLPVVTLGEAPQSAAVVTPTTAPATRLAMVSDLGNGMGTARLEAAVLGGAEPASPVAAALVDPLAPTASAEQVAMAGTLSNAVIAGSVVNNANLINNGSILGQLVNSFGATAVNTGVIRGLVTNNGTVTSVGTLSGGLSNSGTARISGVLTGDVLNAGGITLTGITTGIAVFQQATTGSLNLGGFDTTLGVLSGAGTIALGNARLTTGTNGVNSQFSGVISGTGALTKTGTGGLILDGDNVYSGGTTVAAGALQLGNGGTTGSIIGPVINNGTLIINRSNAYSFNVPITGTGMFVQAGTGTTTLTGPNSYTGGTLISSGRLIGSTVSLQGVIQNDAALEFAQGTNGVFNGRIGGTGLLDKTGTGLLELTADSSGLRGATTVRSGELRVTGSLAGSATTVLSGASLSGTGTVGGLIARSGAVVSPGVNGLGMLGVNGAIQLQSGSTLRLQIQAPAGSDMLIGNGTMQLGGTAALTNLGGTYAFNSNYLLLQASGGRTGAFEAVTGLGEFGILYRPELVYTANQVLLRMAPNLLTNIVGTTPLTANQRSVVARIDSAVTAGYNPQPLFAVYSLPNAQQPNAFDQLSGEVYATAAGVGIEQERLVREAVLGRLGAVTAASRQTPEWGNGAGAWAQVFGSWGDGNRDGNAARYQSDRQGFITGIDYGNANSEGSWRIGAFGMHMTSKVSVDARGSRAEVEQTGGGLYAGVNSGGVSVGMGASVTGVDLTSVRNIVLPGFAETNRGRGDGRAVQGFAELSYAIDAGNATYRPFASVAAGSFRLEALTETGGAAALSVRRQSYSSGSITVGTDGVVRMGKVQLSGTVASRVQIGDRDPAAQIALAAAPAQAFAIRGVQLDSFALAARLDATVKLGGNADLSLGYTGLIGKDTADHGARATLSVRF